MQNRSGLAQPEGQADDAVLRGFVSDRIEVQRPGDAGEGGEPQAAVLAAADFLQDDGHLLLGDDIARGRDVAAGRCEIDRGIDTLDGLGDETELLVLVLRRRNHISGIDSGKRLIIRIFQL